jgi:hypothetical protein
MGVEKISEEGGGWGWMDVVSSKIPTVKQQEKNKLDH